MDSKDRIILNVELYDGEFPEPVDTVSFDATDILGAMSNEELAKPDDIEHFDYFEQAMECGLAEEVGCGFVVRNSSDYEEYYKGRMSGEIKPNKDLCESQVLNHKIMHANVKIFDLKDKISRLEGKIEGYRGKLKEISRRLEPKVEIDVSTTLMDAMLDRFKNDGWDIVSSVDEIEAGLVCLERWTDMTGCDMIFNIDMRGKDADNPADWREAVYDAIESFDVDEEVRARMDAPGAPGISEMVEDFIDYQDNTLEPLEDAVNEVIEDGNYSRSESLDEMMDAKSAEAEYGEDEHEVGETAQERE